jgi:hypothetical protein
VVQPKLGAPLWEAHSGLAAKESGEGTFARSHRAAEFGEGSFVARMVGEDRRHVAQSGVGRVGQVKAHRRCGCELAQRDSLQVGALVRGERPLVGERDDQLAQERGHAQDRRLPYVALAAAVVAGVAVNIPFSVLVKLGQDYLPTRPGTASGVTLGLAVSIGGLIAPVFGVIAQARGTQAVFTVLCFVPILALTMAAFLPEPHRLLGDQHSGDTTSP